VVVIVWQLDLQLPMQSVHITTEIVSSNPVHGEVYSIQHYMIKWCFYWPWPNRSISIYICALIDIKRISLFYYIISCYKGIPLHLPIIWIYKTTKFWHHKYKALCYTLRFLKFEKRTKLNWKALWLKTGHNYFLSKMILM
jgi:hypothetical protein